jgi:light-regulated signal transduction histidine kinase (bacteriophytochrome)
MVSSYTQLLARRYKGRLDADADEFIAFAVDGVTRMQGLINDLLLYARIGSPGDDLLPVDSGVILDKAIANLEGAIRDTRATISRTAMPVVRADPAQIAQLFQNLLGNALKFHGEAPPKITVSAERDGAAWRFSVRDEGIGIEPAYFDRIFVIFQRLHARDKYQGTGIGLSICKKIVERHRGAIWVESVPGAGSTFHFTLPIEK